MKYYTRQIIQTFASLFILIGILAITVAVGHAAFVTPTTVLKVIQK